jgi:hypothetical protein
MAFQSLSQAGLGWYPKMSFKELVERMVDLEVL